MRRGVERLLAVVSRRRHRRVAGDDRGGNCLGGVPFLDELIDNRRRRRPAHRSQRLADPIDDHGRPLGSDVPDRWHRLAADADPEGPLDLPEPESGTSGDERHGHAVAPGAARPPDAMEIILGIDGEVVVDDEGEVVDIDPAGGDVGGHEPAEGPALEAVHDPRPLRLGHATVEPLGGTAAVEQPVGEFVDHPLRVAKHEAAARIVEIDEAAERGRLGVMADLVEHLIDRRRASVTGPVDADLAGGAGMMLDEATDRRREGGGEEHRLAVGRRGGEKLLEILAEAHVEHPIGLVEDEDLDSGEIEAAATEEIDEPPWRADDDLRPPSQIGELSIVGGPTVDRHGADPLLEGGEFLRLRCDLSRQLARGDEDQHLRLLRGRIDPLDRRDAERRRLPGAGLRLTDNVRAAEERGDGAGLDLGRDEPAELLDRADKFWRDAERRERHGRSAVRGIRGDGGIDGQEAGRSLMGKAVVGGRGRGRCDCRRDRECNSDRPASLSRLREGSSGQFPETHSPRALTRPPPERNAARDGPWPSSGGRREEEDDPPSSRPA